MRTARIFLVGVVSAAGVLALSSCSLNVAIWGAEGAATIEETERLVDAAAAGDASGYVCPGAAPDMRSPRAWEGLTAEEPERFNADYWPQQAPLAPEWNINLGLREDRVASGVEYPGDLFYRAADDGLCLVDVAWSTVE